jgi:hypothetical protein
MTNSVAVIETFQRNREFPDCPQSRDADFQNQRAGATMRSQSDAPASHQLSDEQYDYDVEYDIDYIMDISEPIFHISTT